MTVKLELEYYEIRILQQLTDNEENRLVNHAYENNGSTAIFTALKDEARKYRKLKSKLKNIADQHTRCGDDDLTYQADALWHRYATDYSTEKT